MVAWERIFRRGPPRKERGTIWMAANDALGITSAATKGHPALVLSAMPNLQVVVGSDSHHYDHDAILVDFFNEHLQRRPPGRGFLTVTTFDLGAPVVLADESGLGLYIGRLTAANLKVVADRMERGW